ncbi:unnamed protein product [Arctogadus glacialis]
MQPSVHSYSYGSIWVLLLSECRLLPSPGLNKTRLRSIKKYINERRREKMEHILTKLPGHWKLNQCHGCLCLTNAMGQRGV